MERDPAAAAGIPFGVCLHARPALFDHALSCHTAMKRNSHYDVCMEEIEEFLASPRRTEEHCEAKELAAVIECFLDTQSKENRVLFMRRYWYADSYADIGRLLGITESNARLRLMRMRKQLKTYLIEQEVMA